MTEELLAKYRRILDAIQQGGNIYYDKGRLEAYKIVALSASNERQRRLMKKASFPIRYGMDYDFNTAIQSRLADLEKQAAAEGMTPEKAEAIQRIFRSES